jgi:hypothetical protein
MECEGVHDNLFPSVSGYGGGALIMGIVGGVLGLAIALGLDVTLTSASFILPSGNKLLTLNLVTHAAGPIVTLLDVIIAISKRFPGGALMLIGAAGIALTFQFNFLIAITIILSAVAAILTVYLEALHTIMP